MHVQTCKLYYTTVVIAVQSSELDDRWIGASYSIDNCLQKVKKYSNTKHLYTQQRIGRYNKLKCLSFRHYAQ